MVIIAFLFLVCTPLAAQETDALKGSSWTRVLKDRTERGTLHDAFQKVRGDSGKWNDEPTLQHAPPIETKPAKTLLDDWADQLRTSSPGRPHKGDDNWLLMKTRQLDDNDRLWVERVERRGNQFTVVLCEAIWQGRYNKTFTYYSVFGVNLGKLPPGNYTVQWIVKPLVFRRFEGDGRPRDQNRTDNWPKDEQPTDKQAKQLSVAFTVSGATHSN